MPTDYKRKTWHELDHRHRETVTAELRRWAYGNADADVATACLVAADALDIADKRAPVQKIAGKPFNGPGGVSGTISWNEHMEAWKAYNAKYRSYQSAERIAERHGFSYDELTEFLGHEPTTWKPA